MYVNVKFPTFPEYYRLSAVYFFFFHDHQNDLRNADKLCFVGDRNQICYENLRKLNGYKYLSRMLYPVCDRGHCCVHEGRIGVDWYFMSCENSMALSGIG